MWAQLEQPNDMSGKYQVDLCQLSDAAVENLEAQGITVRTHDDKGSFITCKSKYPIYARDTDGVDLRGIKIGNGSQAVAVVTPFEWKFKGKSGISPSLDKLVITDLEVYEEGDSYEAPDFDEAL
jgi:hypothetical protein